MGQEILNRFIFLFGCCYVYSVGSSKFTFINARNSTLTFQPDVYQNRFVFRLLSNGVDGNILSVLNKNNEKMFMKIDNGKINCTFCDSKSEPIESRVFDHVINAWNDIVIEETKSGMMVRVNSHQIVYSLPLNGWSTQHWVDSRIGSLLTDKNSFIGCIDLVQPKYEQRVDHKRDVLEGCVDACSIQGCRNGGKCINNYKNIACDCTATGFEGLACEHKTPFIILGKNYIKSNSEIPILPIKQINIRFKTNNSYGLLITAGEESPLLKVNLHDGSIHVTCSFQGTFETNIGENLGDNLWHTFRIKIQDNRINVQLDDSLKTSATLQKVEESDRADVKDTKISISIGGNEKNKQKSQFQGQLQHIYVNNLNIIKMLKKNQVFSLTRRT